MAVKYFGSVLNSKIKVGFPLQNTVLFCNRFRNIGIHAWLLIRLYNHKYVSKSRVNYLELGICNSILCAGCFKFCNLINSFQNVME